MPEPRMFLAALRSRSISRPQTGHRNIRSERGMPSPTCPQREHVRVVYAGLTLIRRTSVFLSLRSAFPTRVAHAAS